MTRLLILTLAAFGLLACDKAKDAPAKTDEAPKVDQVALLTKALPAINQAVPAGNALTFEVQKTDEDRQVAPIPKGWKKGFMPGSYEPSELNLGFGTRYTVGSNCDGTCAPKDWAPVAEKVEFSQFRNADSFVIVREEALTEPEGKLIVANTKDGEKTYLAIARWKTGAARYATCNANLAKEAMPLLPAFEAACKAAKPLFLE